MINNPTFIASFGFLFITHFFKRRGEALNSLNGTAYVTKTIVANLTGKRKLI